MYVLIVSKTVLPSVACELDVTTEAYSKDDMRIIKKKKIGANF